MLNLCPLYVPLTPSLTRTNENAPKPDVSVVVNLEFGHALQSVQQKPHPSVPHLERQVVARTVHQCGVVARSGPYHIISVHVGVSILARCLSAFPVFPDNPKRGEQES
jgi:hypothetical protein